MFALVAACGNDDDDNGADDAPPITTQPADDTGNGADDADDDSSSGPPFGGGSEEAYVAGICSAFGDFEDGFGELFALMFSADPDMTEAEEEELMERVAEIFTTMIVGMADSMESLNPPSDIAEYHNQMVAAFREMRDVIQSDDFDFMSDEDLFEGIGDDIDEPPADVIAKYEAIAANNPDCAGLDIFDTEIFE